MLEDKTGMKITDDDVYVDRIDSVFGQWISAYNSIRSPKDQPLRENDYKDYEADRCNRKIGKVREVFSKLSREVESLLPNKINLFIEQCQGVSRIYVYMDANGSMLKWYDPHDEGLRKRVRMVFTGESRCPEFELVGDV